MTAMRLVLGNRDAVHSRDNGETRELMPKGKRATTVDFPDGVSVATAYLQVVTPEQGVWAAHADEGASPAWVASDHATLAQLVADHFGGIEIRELEQ